ncbi:MAG: FkbM family methyltransferase [Chloroflexi bacterium]|uniref:FkbM family methyltransferase n=1 Tax=Candidatus Flexifilum breve TaxID=3140694 RepID=UPI003136EB25|nr:FkbM family methyltransferase [Chloroflexota bacterium]
MTITSTHPLASLLRLSIPVMAKLVRRIPPVHWRVWFYQDRLRKLFSPLYAGNPADWTIIHDFDGSLKMKLRRSTYLGGLIYWHGYQSRNELLLLNRLLSPDMTFVDIGANMGEFTLFAAKRLTNGQVIAFEPQPSLYQLLQENIALNHFQQVRTYNLALADQPGTLTMYTSTDAVAHAGVNEGLASLFQSTERAEVVGEVAVELLDTLLEHEPRIDFIKLDVEGAEPLVLRGAKKLLAKHKPQILMELNREALTAGGSSPEFVLGELRELGYRFELVINDGRGLTRPTEAFPDLCDVLCIGDTH